MTHLEALEDMYTHALQDVYDTGPLEWRAAIDAFEAQAAEIERLRAATVRLVQELESRGVRASQLYALEAVIHAIKASK